MTSSFQSTAGQIFDSPVNTFVEPVTAIRRTKHGRFSRNFIDSKSSSNKFCSSKN